MAEYIEREAAITTYKTFGHLNLHNALEAFEEIPAADVEQVRHGRWVEWWPGDIALIMTGEEMLQMCSECTAKFTRQHRFCPNCGAKMENTE